MLEERDKLVEKLRESQEAYSEATKKLNLVETDNNILMRQLQALMPDVSQYSRTSAGEKPSVANLRI